MTLDVLFEDARIVDGTGAPWFRGAIGVRDGRIAAIERGHDTDRDAGETVDVDGAVVAPGFVDSHSHSDLELFDDPSLEPKIRQGITTEVLGQDGFSMAPVYREDATEEWRHHLAALAGRVDREWTWGGLGAYFDAIDETGIAINVASLVGHGTVRFNVLGMTDRDPTEAELDEMGELVTESLDAGAIGVSTGLVYSPQAYASTDEVRTLTARLEPYGRPFVAHIRSEGRWLWEALDEFVDIGADAGVPLHLSHFKVAGADQQTKAGRAIECIEVARERGVDITAEQYPYTAGSTALSSALPPWVHSEGPERTLDHLRDEETRERIRRDIEDWRIDGWENVGALTGWDGVVIASVESDANQELVGQTIAEIAADREIDPVGAVCELLVEEELDSSMIIHMMDEDDIQEILAYERVCVATDGLFGGRPHPRVYGTYPRVLGRYVREQNLLTVEEAVRKMTSLPARAMGLDTKGVLRPVMDADLVVFDPGRVGSRATYENPERFPTGIPHVMVDGEFVVRDGELTGALPGGVVRA